MDRRPARTLLHYRLESELGRGGMGVVYRAFDAKLRRYVAVKVLPPDLVSDLDRRKRFLREARTAAAVNHPHIATVHEVGEAGDTAFLVMELVEGRTLRSLIKSGSLTLAESLRIASQVASGLARAHRAGIVHRDLKPDNVMIDDDGLVKILDFGLAKLVEEPLPPGASQVSQMSTATEPVTREGKIVGTAAYMSPEQAKGEPVDARTDVFSFGTMLFEMVTGQLPFKGAGPMETLSAVIKDPPPRASEINSQVSEAVTALIGACLRKPAAERPADARAVAAALAALSLDAPSGASERPGSRTTNPPPAVPRARSPEPAEAGSAATEAAPSSRWILAAPLLLLAGAIAGAVMLGLRDGPASPGAGPAPPSPSKTGPSGADPPPVIRSVAVLPLSIIGEESREAQATAWGIGNQLTTKLNTLAGVRVTPWMTSARFVGRDLDPREIASELGVQALLIGSIRRDGENLAGHVSLVEAATNHQTWSWEFHEEPEDIFSFQSRLASSVARELKGTLSGDEIARLERPSSSSVEAYEFYLRGALEAQANTREGFDGALAFFEKALRIDPDLAEAHVGVGAVYSARHFFGWSCGIECLERAKHHFRISLESDPDLMDAWGGLVHVYWGLLRHRQCLETGQQAVRRSGRRIGGLAALAEAYTLCGLPEKAVPVLREIIRLDPANERAHWFLPIATNWSGQYEATLQAGEEYFKKFGDEPEVHHWVGTAYALLDEPEIAEIHLELAVKLQGRNTNYYTILTASAVHRLLGNEERSEELLESFIGLKSPTLEAHPDQYRLAISLASAHALLGHRNAVDRLLGYLPEEARGSGWVQYAILGDPGEALRQFETFVESEGAIFQSGSPPIWADEDLAALTSHPRYKAARARLEERRRKLREEF